MTSQGEHEVDHAATARRSFTRRADGTYAPKHVFASDILAIVVSLIGILVVSALIVLAVIGVAMVTEKDAARPRARLRRRGALMADDMSVSAPPRGFGGARGAAPGQTGASGAGWHSGPEGPSASAAGTVSRGPMPSAFDALGPGARSIVLPGIILLILVAGGLVATVVGTVGLIGSIADTDAFTFEDGSSALSATGADEVACGAERGRLERGIAGFQVLEGRPPTSASELVPRFIEGEPSYYRVEVVDGEAQVVPRVGSACADAGESDRENVERSREAVDAIGGAASLGLFLAGLLGLAAAVGYQGWWLASAYRCLPLTRQSRSPRTAYRPLIVYAVFGLVAGSTQAALVSSEVAYEEPLTAFLILLFLQLVYVGFMVVALLRVIDMIGDVTFHFCAGHYLTSRLMKLSVKGALIFPIASFVLSIGLGIAGADAAAVLVLLVGYGLGLLLCPVVGLVSYIVAVSLAISGVEKALKMAAADLTNGVVKV